MTIIVEIERFFKHPLYEKRIRRTKRYAVHTEGQHSLGETVQFVSTRPMSKAKKWKVVGAEKVKPVEKVKKESKVRGKK
jgi:small subunit ribosomal protein S17